MTQLARQLQHPAPANAPADPVWVEAKELDYTARHVRRTIFPKFEKIGAAKKQGKSYLFKRSHPEIAARLAKVRRDLSYEDLTDLSQKQIDDARRKVSIVECGRSEIAQRMHSARCGRTDAVTWFCTVRAPELGLGSVPLRTFYRLENTYDAVGDYKLRGMVDNRGRAKRGEHVADPRAWEHFLALYLDDKRRRKVIVCHELTAAEADRQGWRWQTETTTYRRVKAIPRAVRIRRREGQRAFETKCLPRAQRSYEDLPANDHWCMDECTLDFYARAIAGDGQWKRCRLVLTAILDVRSRMFVGWHIDRAANSDTIVAAFRKAVARYGPPRDVTCDNGEDYKSVGGRRRKKNTDAKWTYFHEPHLANIYSELGIAAHWTIPYHAWSKIIEPQFRPVHDRFDTLFESYCGNKPENRPEHANKIRIDQLPALDEVRKLFDEWVAAHHQRRITGDGAFNLAPAQIMEQFRGDVREAPTADLLDYLCARIVSRPVTVTKNGVRHAGIYYGQDEEALFSRQGEKVLLKIQPGRADCVWVLDLNRRPIVLAKNHRLKGVKQKDVREGARRRKRFSKVEREYFDSSDVALDTSASAAIKAMHDHHRAQQEPMPEPSPPATIKLTRPDLRQAVEQASKPDRQDVEAILTGSDDDQFDQFDVYEFLADRAESRDAAEDGTDNANDDECLADVFGTGEDNHDDLQDDNEPADGIAHLAKRYGSAG